MEDPEEKTVFIAQEVTKSIPLLFCGTIFRIKKTPLTMIDLVKTVACIHILQCVCMLSIMITTSSTEQLQWLAVATMFPNIVLYTFMTVNLMSGGWGAPSSRFWCDVKIMYVRGFNTIRVITRMFSTTISLCLLATILQLNSFSTLALLPLLGVLVEWQSGLSENRNQYDIKAFDTFLREDNRLCLETVHYFQSQKKSDAQWYTPFVVSTIIRTYVISALVLASRTTISESPTFGIPIACVIVLHYHLLPLIMELSYLKSAITFCQLEIYRMVAELVFPCIVVGFALV